LGLQRGMLETEKESREESKKVEVVVVEVVVEDGEWNVRVCEPLGVQRGFLPSGSSFQFERGNERVNQNHFLVSSVLPASAGMTKTF
jgi:hypothetical protein